MSNSRIDDLKQLVEAFKALSNPHRLGILVRLLACCPQGAVCQTQQEARACVGELGKDLGIVPSTVSHHLKELRRAGLIRMERRGQSIECRVDRSRFRELRDFFDAQAPKETEDEYPKGR